MYAFVLLLCIYNIPAHRVIQKFLCLIPLHFSYVCIAMEALDQLLMACHCQSINLFVESFLKMVRKLLESDKPNLQILGTNSVGFQDYIANFSVHQMFYCFGSMKELI